MRCAPYAIAYRHAPTELTQVSLDSSSITHADHRCTYGCAILNHTIANLLDDQHQPLDAAIQTHRDNAPQELLDALDKVPKDLEDGDVRSSGYVVDTLN